MILSEQTITGFAFNMELSASIVVMRDAFTLTAGQWYTVAWDGSSRKRCAYSATFEGVSYIAIGNEAMITQGGDLVDPFIIAYDPDSGNCVFVAYDLRETHEVSIQTSRAPASVKLKDWYGKDHTFEDVPMLYVRNADGKATPYSAGLAVESMETQADFSKGDMFITPEIGDMVRTVTVKAPETLVPEHVKKGVKIAGIVGNFAGDIANKTVSLSMADGDQVIKADANTVLTSVTVRKPATLKPENIMKGVNIGGVVGTLEGHEDAHWVTFKNGNTFLLKRTVADGDDCADVISRGLIQTPTKDNQTFAGWSSTDGGAVDGDALKAVTEDRTVYAVFTDTGLYGTNLWLEYVHNATQNGKNIEVI